MNWIIVFIFLLVIFIVFKFVHTIFKFKLLAILIIVLFLYVSFSNIIPKKDIEVNLLSSMVVAGESYFEWIGHVFKNSRDIVGNAIRMDWAVPHEDSKQD